MNYYGAYKFYAGGLTYIERQFLVSRDYFTIHQIHQITVSESLIRRINLVENLYGNVYFAKNMLEAIDLITLPALESLIGTENKSRLRIGCVILENIHDYLN